MSGHSKWANIKNKKEKTDSQRGRIFTKIGRELAIAVKEGGPDPVNNNKLRDVIAKAKANNDAIDAKAAQDNAVIVATLAHLPWVAFGPGTDKGAKTKAKPTIWTEQVKFQELADDMKKATTELAAAARTNNLDNLKGAFGDAAKSCKACHDNYRAK